MERSNLHANAALAIFPSVEGFGWIVFDGPLSPVDWEVCEAAKPARGGQKNKKCLERAEEILNEYQPATLILEAFEGTGTRRHERIRELSRSLIALAATYSVPVRILTREQISRSFISAPAETRYQAATIAATYLNEIRHLLPRRRKIYEPEFPQMALFAAAALLIVHYANPTEPL